MEGNVRFGSSLPSPDDLTFARNYLNGQRGNCPAVSLDRSGSFREGSESHMFSSGNVTSRGSAPLMGDIPPLSQCLTLDPISMGDQKYTRSGELRRVLGISFGSTAEDNEFGAAHSKPTPPMATEELRRFKASVLDASIKARGRAKKMDESLYKLNRYYEAINSTKQQRNEMLTNERSSGNNMLKMGTQIRGNHAELVGQRLEDRNKNVVLNKRIRSSVAETRAQGRSNALPRQALVMGKNRDMRQDVVEGSDPVEEKIRRLPGGGGGWDKKMKRKRSVGSVFTRPMDSDGDPKRAMHLKLNNDPGLQPCEAQGFRSGSSNGNSGINKLDGASLSATSNGRAVPKNELEKGSVSRDFTSGFNKERLMARGNNKSNTREGNHMSPTSVTKGKAGRAPRTGPVSSPNFPRTSAALEGWEQPPSINKIHSVGGANNRKRSTPTGSSSPPMAQWVGQRPQKISRTRRTNLVSPVSNQDEMQISSEGCSPSDLGARVTSSGNNGSHPARGMANGIQQLRVKHENISSPARLSESDESGTGENREISLKEKGMGSGEVEEKPINAVQNVASVLLTKKTQILNKEEIGDGVRRQGRSGRGSSFSRAGISPTGEKLENQTSTKPLKSMRPGSDKNGSKSGRPPLKKLSDRKAFTHLGNTSTGGSPVFTGESDDDHEELLAAATFACNASSYLASASPFWKKMESVFASVSIEDTFYMKQQLKSTTEFHESLSQMFGQGNNVLDGFGHEEIFLSHTVVTRERDRSMPDEIGSEDLGMAVDLVGEVQDTGTLCGILGSEIRGKVAPLYQRILSALIVEGETEELEENSGGKNMSFHGCRDDSTGHTCLPIDGEPRKRDWMEFEYESKSGLKNQKQHDRFSCNGTTTSFYNHLSNDGFFQGGRGSMHSEKGMFPDLAKNGVNGLLDAHKNSIDISSLDWQYEEECLEDKIFMELQSVGLYPETVPDLADGEEGSIDQDILKLQNRVHKQVGKKKAHFTKIIEAIEDDREMKGRVLEQVAMNKLVELAYRKQLATRGSSASKSGVSKVPKHVALAFMKRTLGRCRKFEDTGKSCFTEPALRDAIFATPRNNDAEPLDNIGLAASINLCPETHNSRLEPGTSGSFRDNYKTSRGSSDAYGILTHTPDQDFANTGPLLNRGKKKELLLDDVGGSASLRASSTVGNPLLGGAKGKRSERERDKEKSSRNSVPKTGRTLGNFRGERKTKAKPKQKTAQLSTSGHGFAGKFTETDHSVYLSPSGSSEMILNASNRKKEVGLISHGHIPGDLSSECKEPMDLLESIEELDAADALNGHHDLDTWLGIEEDGLQDHDSVGLDIPMDDLSELHMF